jgi:hypothetical protein
MVGREDDPLLVETSVVVVAGIREVVAGVEASSDEVQPTHTSRAQPKSIVVVPECGFSKRMVD